MLDGLDGGLQIRNLKLIKKAFITKNAFRFLNSYFVIWMDVLKLKYDLIKPWNLKIPPKCSLFYSVVCQTIDEIKPIFGLKDLIQVVHLSLMILSVLKSFLISNQLL